MKNLSSAVDAIGKVNYPDMSKFADIATAMGKINYPDMSKFTGIAAAMGKINYPDMSKFTGTAAAIGKVNYPDMSKFTGTAAAIGKVNYPDMSKFTGTAAAMGKINYPDMSKFTGIAAAMGKINYPDADKIASLIQSLTIFSDKIERIDWKSFELTDEDVRLSNEILDSEKAEDIVSKELSENKEPNKISKSVKSVILFIYHFMLFLAATTQVAQYVENTVIPIVKSYTRHEQENVFQSDKVAVKWINDELKKDVSNQITKNFRIVVKNNLVVREGKSSNSRITGQLNAGHVVQIIEKRRNWSYVIYSNYMDGQVTEGWVLTRYLRQIK